MQILGGWMSNFRRWRVPVLGLALVCLLGMARTARAAEDVVQFGNTIEVGPDATVHDAVCFFCSVHVRGHVSGDIVVFFGGVELEGTAKQDVVDFFGPVRAADNASIGGNLVNFFGGAELGEDARVSKDTVVMFGNLRAATTASFGGDRVVQPIWVFLVPFVLLVLGINALVQMVRGNRYRRYYARGL